MREGEKGSLEREAMVETDTREITVIWKAFGEPTQATVKWAGTADVSDRTICEFVFRDTNIYFGDFWNLIEPVLPEDRTHTALSVGDEVEVNGKRFRCEAVGWQEVTA